MADEKKTADKEALKAQKQAEKDAIKAKKERVKQSKPKKEGNIFVRMWNAIRKFFKGFRGNVKKVTWPDRKTVIKNSLVVLATVIIVGAGIWIVDFGLQRGVRGIQNVIANTAEEESSDAAVDTADAAAADTADADAALDALADAAEAVTEDAA